MATELRHVLWIGGPPASGKTSVATRLARRHGLRWYGADTRTWAHRDRAVAEGHPAALRWEAMTPEERRADAAPAELLALSLHVERGSMIVDDVRALPASPLIVADGAPVAPAVVSSGLADPARAVWLLPTAEFQQARLDERELPPAARRFYGLLADELARAVAEHDAPTLVVDGSSDLDETVAAVEERFAGVLAAGPCAGSRGERQVLLREANEAVVAQMLAFYARPWATDQAESDVRPFLCECADPGCEAVVTLPVTTLPAEPLLAAGHG